MCTGCRHVEHRLVRQTMMIDETQIAISLNTVDLCDALQVIQCGKLRSVGGDNRPDRTG